jgi:eukaryotic-like serine/threonine-protein kinase
MIGDRYRVVRLLGRGGMGAVYVVEHVLLGKRFALKLLPAEAAKRNPDMAERFEREARALSLLHHPHIVDVSDFGNLPDGTSFLVMALLDGPHLGDVIVRAGRLPFARAQRLALQLCSALELAHASGIVHRDVKPENVIVVDDLRLGEQAKLLDFGLARALSGNQRRLTHAGVVMGTAEYLSPEQARGGEIDERSDVYSFGCLLYEMLTGVPPFEAKSPVAVMRKHVFDPPEPPTSRAPGIDLGPDGEAVVLRALAKDPAARFQSMADLRQALAECRSLPADERPGGPARPDRALVAARDALGRGDKEIALKAAERAVALCGAVDAAPLKPHRELLEKVYAAALGDRRRVLTVREVPVGIDARAAFLLSRVDGSIAIEDLLEVSGMPRLEAARMVALFLRSGVLGAGE